MTTIEEQLRTYATAVAGPVRHGPDEVDEPRPNDEPTHLLQGRGPKLALRAAALVLVVLAIAAVLAVRSRSEDNSPASSVTEWYPLRVKLEVNTTAPSPTQMVRATMTVTNISADPFELPQLCPSDISLMPSAEERERANPTTIPLDLDDLPPSTDPTTFWADLTPTEKLGIDFPGISTSAQFGTERSQQSGSDPEPCPRTERIELQPGGSTSVRGYLDVGRLGLDPTAMSLVAFARPYEQTKVLIPFTLPRSPDDVLTRSVAFKTMMAQPAVDQWARLVLDNAASPSDATHLGAGTAHSLGNGWEMLYESGDHRLLVQMNADGTGTITADGVESPIDPTLAN